MISFNCFLRLGLLHFQYTISLLASKLLVYIHLIDQCLLKLMHQKTKRKSNFLCLCSGTKNWSGLHSIVQSSYKKRPSATSTPFKSEYDTKLFEASSDGLGYKPTILETSFSDSELLLHANDTERNFREGSLPTMSTSILSYLLSSLLIKLRLKG